MHRILLKPILLLAATVVAVEVSQPDATVTDPNTDEGPPSYIRGGSEGSIQYAPATAGQDPAAVDADSSGWGLGKSKGKRRTVTSTGEIIEESDDDEEIDFVITVIFVLMLLMLGAAYMYFSRRNAIAREVSRTPRVLCVLGTMLSLVLCSFGYLTIPDVAARCSEEVLG